MTATISIKYYLDCQGGVLEIDDAVELNSTGIFDDQTSHDEMIQVLTDIRAQVREAVGKRRGGNMIFGTKYVDISKLVACDIQLSFPGEEASVNSAQSMAERDAIMQYHKFRINNNL